jgi:hypothetical protein
MIFENEDDGPFYMPSNLQQVRKHDEIRGKKVKNRLKKDLCEELEKIGISTRGKTLKDVQEIAAAKNIPITTEECDILEGWLGSQKESRQFCGSEGCWIQMSSMLQKLKRMTQMRKGR